MNMLQNVLIVAAAVLSVLALCSGIKAVCRKMLSKTGEKSSKL